MNDEVLNALDEMDGCTSIDEITKIADVLFPIEKNDVFWRNAAHNLFIQLVLFDLKENNKTSFRSIYNLLKSKYASETERLLQGFESQVVKDTIVATAFSPVYQALKRG